MAGNVKEGSGRSVINVSLTSKAKAQLDELLDVLKMQQQDAVGRIIEWVTGQQRLVQLLVLGLIDEEDTLHIIDLLYRKAIKGAASEENVALTAADEKLMRRVLKILGQSRGTQVPQGGQGGPESATGKGGRKLN